MPACRKQGPVRAAGADGRLTLLAPDIVEAILDGRQPDGVALPSLVGPFLLEWARQPDAGCSHPAQKRRASLAQRASGPRRRRRPARAARTQGVDLARPTGGEDGLSPGPRAPSRPGLSVKEALERGPNESPAGDATAGIW